MVDLMNKFSKLILGREFKTIDDEKLEMTREEKFYDGKSVFDLVSVTIFFIYGMSFGIFLGLILGREYLSISFLRNFYKYVIFSFTIMVGLVGFISIYYYKSVKPRYKIFKNEYEDLYEKIKPQNKIYKYKSNLLNNRYINDIKERFFIFILSVLGIFLSVYIVIISSEELFFLIVMVIFILFSIFVYIDSLKKKNERERAIEKIKNHDANSKKE